MITGWFEGRECWLLMIYGAIEGDFPFFDLPALAASALLYGILTAQEVMADLVINPCLKD